MSKVELFDYATIGDIPVPPAGRTGLASHNGTLYRVKPDGTKDAWFTQTDLMALQAQVNAIDLRVATLEGHKRQHYVQDANLMTNGNTTINFGSVSGWQNTMSPVNTVWATEGYFGAVGWHSYEIDNIQNLIFRLSLTGSVSGGPFYTTDTYQTWQQRLISGQTKINHTMTFATSANLFQAGETVTIQMQVSGPTPIIYVVNSSGEGDQLRLQVYIWNLSL